METLALYESYRRLVEAVFLEPALVLEYVRHSFQWAAFPGWDGAPDPPLDLIRGLAGGLEPI